jgi:hypothetical protein
MNLALYLSCLSLILQTDTIKKEKLIFEKDAFSLCRIRNVVEPIDPFFAGRIFNYVEIQGGRLFTVNEIDSIIRASFPVLPQ